MGSSATAALRKTLLGGGAAREGEAVEQAEKCIVRIMKPPKKKRTDRHRGHKLEVGSEHTYDDDDDDDASVVSHLDGHDDAMVGLSPLDSGFRTPRIPGFDVSEGDGGGSNEVPGWDEWTTKHELPLKIVDVAGRDGKAVRVSIRSKSGEQCREVVFETEKEASAFCRLMDLLKEAQTGREETVRKAAMGSLKIDKEKLEERVELLIEIVSCWDLPVTGVKSSDPYVVVRAGDHVFHQTKHIPSSLHPIYTMKTDSFFILGLPVKKLFELEGLIFEVKDAKRLRDDRSVGAVMVEPRTLFQSNGERLEFKLKPLLGGRMYGRGRIAIRCRHATPNDMKVMLALTNKKDLYVEDTAVDITGLPGLRDAVKKKVHRNKSFDGEKKNRVMPGPDPERSESTKWMSDAEIQEESMKVSRDWAVAGSGKLGKVYLEVLGCDGLPNLDHGPPNDKTDAFVTIVYEDTVVRTDVVSDCLSPRWLPWTRRAFVFNTMHCSSQLFLVVANHNSSVGNEHDIVGRFAVNLATLYPGTEYFMVYNLHDSEDISRRKPRGKISVRIVVQIEDDRAFMLSNLAFPPTVHVNVVKKKDFALVRYACTGKQGKEKYGRKQVNALVEELLSYKLVLFYAKQAFVDVILWRRHFPVQLPGWSRKVCLPLNSIGAFVAGVYVVERPHLLPSLFFALIGWMLTVVLAFRNGHGVSPWTRCKPFSEHVRMLALDTTMQPQTIKPGERQVEAEAFAEKWESRIKESEEMAILTNKKYQERLRLHQEELEEIGEIEEISTKPGGSGISVDPLRVVWIRLQDALEYVVHAVRFLWAVCVWEEAYISFWLCVFSYILAVLFFVVPWVWIVRWMVRIVVWVFLGPWMKLVDIYWEEKIKPALDNMHERSERKRMQAKVAYARTERENTKKLKVYKKLLFGKYIIEVPVLKYGSRFSDTPLPDSHARPATQSSLNIEEAAKGCRRVGGQQLVGNMIPVIESEAVHAEKAVPNAPMHGSKLEESSEKDPLLTDKN